MIQLGFSQCERTSKSCNFSWQ